MTDQINWTIRLAHQVLVRGRLSARADALLVMTVNGTSRRAVQVVRAVHTRRQQQHGVRVRLRWLGTASRMRRRLLSVEGACQVDGSSMLRETGTGVGRYLRRLLTGRGRLVLMLRILRH